MELLSHLQGDLGPNFPKVAQSLFIEFTLPKRQYREVRTKITTSISPETKSLKAVACFELTSVDACLIGIHTGVAGRPA